MNTADRVAELRAKIAAAKAQASGPVATKPALIPTNVIQEMKTTEATSPQEISAVESTLLEINPEMKAFEGFDPTSFVQRLTILEGQIAAKAPGVANYLQDINKNLHQYPELVHLLNDDQLAVITQGLLFLTNTNMVAAAASGKSRKELTTEQLSAAFGF